jgi:hypothetical protein
VCRGALKTRKMVILNVDLHTILKLIFVTEFRNFLFYNVLDFYARPDLQL